MVATIPTQEDGIEAGPAAAEAISAEKKVAIRRALVQLAVLLVLWAWAFRPQLAQFAERGLEDSNWAHLLAAPLVILILAARRRAWLAQCEWKGSAWGLVGVLGGVLVYAASIWPVEFGYTADLALVPVLGGLVLAAAGAGVLRRCLPMLLVVLLSIPIGQRAYAALIIRPETYTLATARFVLDQLPGVKVTLDGPDLHFARPGQAGVIALGESNRGVALVASCTVIGVCVTFCRIRPVWQIVALAAAAGPIVLTCNLMRLMTWGLMTVYGGALPDSSAPRAVAAVVALLLAWVAFGTASVLLDYFSAREPVEDEPAPTPADDGEPT
jgi:hypothetical protein